MAIIQLERLIAPGTYDWGHIAMEAHLVPKEFRGQGIKVGIIDTGIQADPPHEVEHTGVAFGFAVCLQRVAKGLNCVTGDFPDNQEKAPDSWKDDVDQHGSHCELPLRRFTSFIAGIVAASCHFRIDLLTYNNDNSKMARKMRLASQGEVRCLTAMPKASALIAPGFTVWIQSISNRARAIARARRFLCGYCRRHRFRY